MKPVRLHASATLALPRWGLLALALLYILAGLIGRDPWKNDDAASFGIMWTMAHGGWQDWLLPNIVGMPVIEEGPLTFWISAICIKLFGWLLGDAMAARMANILFFMLGAISLWAATYRLGKRPEAQPMRLAFGGQPEPKDYGRMLADGALLIYIGCLGLLMHSHETTAEALLVSLAAMLLYASVRYAESPGTRNACLIGLTLGCLGLTHSWTFPIALWLALLVFFCWWHESIRKTAPHLLLALAIGVTLTAIWVGSVLWLKPFNLAPLQGWMAWHTSQIGLPSWETVKFFFKYGVWFYWPAWPFAGWAVYAWRRQRSDIHIVLPLCFALVLSTLALFDPGTDESSLLPLLPALAMLAAFGLPTMRRGAINAVDWFSVMALTVCALFVWVGWIALNTGWPPRMVKNIGKYAPGFTPGFSAIALLVAACGTVAWFVLVYWRISRQPKVLWRAVVLSSGGVILVWLLLTTLWLPWINYAKSYDIVARQIARNLPTPQTCVNGHVGQAQRAAFAYHGKIRFAPIASEHCNFLLLQDKVIRHRRSKAPIVLPPPKGNWKLVWEGSRPAEEREYFRLYQRK
ncbi:MAG: glycosyltransferase [Oxalobacter sp.]|nr:MAG: glycosyltransferase [Oxalobacter sp.]